MTVESVKVDPKSMRMSLDTNNNRQGGSAHLRFVVTVDRQYYPFELYLDASAFLGGPHRLPIRYEQYTIIDYTNLGSPVLVDSETGIFARDFVVSPDKTNYKTRWYVDVTYRPLDPWFVSAGCGSQPVGPSSPVLD